MPEPAMDTQTANTELVEKKPLGRARRAARRRYARELERFALREICESFELRGPDSDIDIAETFEAQRPSVVSILLHELFRRVRRVESRQVASERIATIDTRKGIAA